MARGAILLSNEVPFLWEWLPATIIAVRRGGLPQKNIQLHWKPKFTRRANPAECGVSAGGGPQRQSAAGGKRNAEIGLSTKPSSWLDGHRNPRHHPHHPVCGGGNGLVRRSRQIAELAGELVFGHDPGADLV